MEFTNENFAEIILNFLGHKQQLQYIVHDTHFILDKENLAQFHYLLLNKIEKEQFTHLNSFVVKLQYHNNTTRLVHGIEQLNTFLETQPLAPQSITLSWKIILQFPNASNIESQDIEVTFNIDPHDGGDEIYLYVEHTNQSWGTEVLNLFKDHIDNIQIQKPKQVKVAEIIQYFIVPKRLTDLLMILSLILLMSFAYLDSNNNYSDEIGLNQIMKMAHSEEDAIDLKEFQLSLYLIDKRINKDVNLTIDSPLYKQIIKEYIEKSEITKDFKIKRIASIIIFIFGVMLTPYF